MTSNFQVSFSIDVSFISSGSWTSDELTCNFQVLVGPDWQVVRGETAGCTQTAVLRTGKAVFNFPINLVLTSTNISGWPRLVVSVIGNDLFNRKVIRGYTSVALPVAPGNFEKISRLFSPQASSSLANVMGWISGRRPEISDPKSLDSMTARESLKVVTTDASLHMRVDVLWKNHKQFEFVF
jgi:B9 domain-containing protein 1